MPEGDTIWKAAERIRPALEGATVLRFEAPRLVGERPRDGTRIDAVEAAGKHLLVHFAGGLSLDTHMRMTGTWRLVRPGERWPRAAHRMRVRIDVAGWQALCFDAPVVRTFRARSAVPGLGDPRLALGPDLCRADADTDEAVRRLAAVRAPTSIAEALLDQRVVAGVGNVYKSEVLHACGVDPFVAADAVDDEVRAALVATAARMLRANLGPGRRTTVAGPPGSVAVYRRARRPCRRCGTPIRMARHGEHQRSTYWCPRCQPPGAGTRAAATLP